MSLLLDCLPQLNRRNEIDECIIFVEPFFRMLGHGMAVIITMSGIFWKESRQVQTRIMKWISRRRERRIKRKLRMSI